MSKSKGNLVFVSKLLDQGIDPVVIRFALLQGHYSQDRMWSESILQSSAQAVERIRLALAKLEIADTTKLMSAINAALADDLDTPKALDLLDEWAKREISNESKTDSYPGYFARYLDAVLGLAL
jgi:L-cysteine:1D-myo-inositol 2-amino-2-deoxy-alpha-D-glucopyranoside ligase